MIGEILNSPIRTKDFLLFLNANIVIFIPQIIFFNNFVSFCSKIKFRFFLCFSNPNSEFFPLACCQKRKIVLCKKDDAHLHTKKYLVDRNWIG